MDNRTASDNTPPKPLLELRRIDPVSEVKNRLAVIVGMMTIPLLYMLFLQYRLTTFQGAHHLRYMAQFFCGMLGYVFLCYVIVEKDIIRVQGKDKSPGGV